MKNTAREAEENPGKVLFEAMLLGDQHIPHQEKAGQYDFINSELIPVECSLDEGDDILRSLGFELGDILEGDELFRHAKLPAGWKKVASDHSMWMGFPRGWSSPTSIEPTDYVAWETQLRPLLSQWLGECLPKERLRDGGHDAC